MDESHNDPQFTPQAQQFWAKVPETFQQRVLENVWCGTCNGATTIVDYQGRIQEGDLVLTGKCTTCGGKVARLVEAE